MTTSDFLCIYFGSLGFCYIFLFSGMLFLHWRKGMNQNQRAIAWVKQMKAESYFERALAHPTDKKHQTGSKTQDSNPGSVGIPKLQRYSSSSEIIAEINSDSIPSFPDTEPCKLVFQEVPCACALSYFPPLLEHSASYPCSSISAKGIPFNSPLKSTILRNETCNIGSSVSA